MRVSGKITHSFYCYLKERGFDVSRFFELTSLEMEFLKDPSQWMELTQVELFLKHLDKEYSAHFVDQDFLIEVGHACFDLSAWGELDSVLKTKRAEPVFANMSVFLSYFVSEGFSITSERTEPGFFSFKCNLSSDNFPFVTEYLRSALEALPMYTGQGLAEVKWIRDYIQILWNKDNRQISLFTAKEDEIHIKPELFKELNQILKKQTRAIKPQWQKDLHNFLKTSKVLYQHRKSIAEKEKQIRHLKDQLLLHGGPLPDKVLNLIGDMEQSLLKLKSSASSRDEEFITETSSLPSQVDELLKIFNQLKTLLSP